MPDSYRLKPPRWPTASCHLRVPVPHKRTGTLQLPSILGATPISFFFFFFFSPAVWSVAVGPRPATSVLADVPVFNRPRSEGVDCPFSLPSASLADSRQLFPYRIVILLQCCYITSFGLEFLPGVCNDSFLCGPELFSLVLFRPPPLCSLPPHRRR